MRNQTTRGVGDVENDANAVGSAAENGRRAARLREGLRGEFLEGKAEEDDVDFGFDGFDDGYDDWSDEDSEGWSDEEDSEESSRRQGWRWGSKKSGTQVKVARSSVVTHSREVHWPLTPGFKKRFPSFVLYERKKSIGNPTFPRFCCGNTQSTIEALCISQGRSDKAVDQTRV